MKTRTDLARMTARDLMQTKIVQLDADLRIDGAVAILEENRISGAPVVDGERLVGVLSARDVARSEHLQEGRIAAEGRDYDLADADAEDPWEEEQTFAAKEGYSGHVMDGSTVRDWMNPDVLSVPPTAELAEVCRTMLEERVHRLLVVEKDKLVGLVSTFDLVRCLSEAL